MSDTGSETAGGGAAALLLAGFDRLASAGHIEVLRGVLAVALRASYAKQGVADAGQKCSSSSESAALAALRNPADRNSLIAYRHAA